MGFADQPMAGSAAKLHHLGLVVDDLQRAAEHFARTYGVGPFLAIPHVEFDELTYNGEPCVWEHALAFGAWGEIQIELQQQHAIRPTGLAELIGRTNVFTHASYRVSSLEEETERLAGTGVEPFLHARTGPVEFSFFRDPGLPTYIEVHRDNPFLGQFDLAVARATRDWDRQDALLALDSISVD